MTVVAASAAICASAANTWYVDDDAESGGNGESETTAFKTIQEGVDAASAGDTVLVLPGTYADVGRTIDDAPSYGNTCVIIDKSITLKSRDGKATTTIQGQKASGSSGYGTDARRCIYVTTSNPVIIQGFTITNGWPQTSDSGVTPETKSNPGGVCGPNTTDPYSLNVWLLDSTVSDCHGCRGGGIRFVNAVRCVIEKCSASGGNSVARMCALFHCHFLSNYGNSWLAESMIVNCTYTDPESATATAHYQLPNPTIVCTYNYNVVASQIYPRNLSATYKNCLFPSSPIATDATKGTAENCIFNAKAYPYVSPMRGDYRVRVRDAEQGYLCGSKALIGDAAAKMKVTIPSAIDLYTSIDGVDLNAQSGDAIQPGAYQMTAETLGGHVFKCSSSYAHFAYGRPCKELLSSVDAYLFFTDSTDSYMLEPVPSSGAMFGRLDKGSSRIANSGYQRWPDMQDRVLITPVAVGTILDNYLMFTTKIYYVNPTTGSDDTGTGASNKPFQSLQKSVEKVKAACGNWETAIIMAAEGTYDVCTNGTDCITDSSGRRSRLLLEDAEGLAVRIKGAGRGKSILKGAYDPDTIDDATKMGRGPKAITCVRFSGTSCYSCIQGFTIQDGYSAYDESEASAEKYNGGLVYGSAHCAQVLDCELKNGVAYRGGVASGVKLSRCNIHDCAAMGGGLIRDCKLFSSIVYGSTSLSDGTSLISQENEVYFCSVYAGIGGCAVSKNIPTYHSIFYGLTDDILIPNTVVGSVYYGYETVGGTGVEGTNYKKVDPLFKDAANGDLRTFSLSKANGWKEQDLTFWSTYPCPADYYGNAPKFIDGKIVPGAVQSMYKGLWVEKAANGEDSLAEGFHELTIGDTVTVTHTGTRPCIGYEMNGVVVTNTDLTWTYTVPENYDSIWLKAHLTTDWYVNANTDSAKGVVGSDTNNGFSPKTPWQTLAQIKVASDAGSLISGDTVHAAAGDYNTNPLVPTKVAVPSKDKYQLPARVQIPSGVTLIADEGAEKTFISGQVDPKGDYGYGTSAIRGVVAEANTKLIGFTVKNCRVASDSGNAATTAVGAGFIGANNTAVAYGCVFTNCVAYRGGAANNGTLANCKILCCGATASSSVQQSGYMIGCYIDGIPLHGSTAQIIRDNTRVSHCTFGPNLSTNSRIKTNDLPSNEPDNCVFLTALKTTNLDVGKNKYFKNCYFVGNGPETSYMDGGKTVATIDELKVGAGGRPTKDSPFVNVTGYTSSYLSYCEGKDLDGKKRKHGAAVEAGCYEYRPGFMLNMQ